VILKSDLIAHRIESSEFRADPLIIAPRPDLQKLKEGGTASVDLRLGTWFMELRRTRTGSLGIMRSKTEPQDEENLARTLYTPFGKEFLLHPQSFILGITLEWIRLPKNLAAYVVGKSS